MTKPTDHWNTPAWLWALIETAWGPIAYDPCSNPTAPGHPDSSDGIAEDGLAVDWYTRAAGGLVYVNPPYSNVGPWATKFRRMCRLDAPCLLLVKLDPTTAWWAEAMADAPGFFAFRKRLKYGRGGVEKQTADFPSALIPSKAPLADELGRHLGEYAQWFSKP